MNSDKEIKCRKCGGNHLTIKCGKTETSKINQNNTTDSLDINISLNDNDIKPYDGERKPYNGERKPYNGERKPYNGERKPYDGERKPYNGERKPYNGERKPYDGERKPYDGERKPYNGERKPYDGERKFYNGERKPYDGERKPYDGERKPYDGERKPYEKKINFKVKINNLPNDISKEELYELCNDWGNIKYINVNGYKDESVAFIEFREEDQCKYFIEALDNTPFDYRIIKISRID
jgi:hypothetical protein